MSAIDLTAGEIQACWAEGPARTHLAIVSTPPRPRKTLCGLKVEMFQMFGSNVMVICSECENSSDEARAWVAEQLEKARAGAKANGVPFTVQRS